MIRGTKYRHFDMNSEIKAVLNEMRDRKVNHGKAYSPTLTAWADRIEAALPQARSVCDCGSSEGNREPHHDECALLAGCNATPSAQVSGGGGALRERLVECRDWFEAQAKVISKGNGSTWDLMQVREQRDLCDTALSTPQPQGDGFTAANMMDARAEERSRLSGSQVSGGEECGSFRLLMHAIDDAALKSCESGGFNTTCEVVPYILDRYEGLHAALSTSQARPDSFQSRVAPWMQECFGPAVASDVRERGDRLLEEVLELLQSHGYDPARVATLRDYVFSRPVGEPRQEVGGVMVTLAAYCLATGIDMHEAGEAELARIWTKVETIRAKQASKRDIHSPLPGGEQARPDGGEVASVEAALQKWLDWCGQHNEEPEARSGARIAIAAMPGAPDVARLVEAAKEVADEHMGLVATTIYHAEDDEVGMRACCGVRSYDPHTPDCPALKLREALAPFIAAQQGGAK